MQREIAQHLEQVERQHNVKILYACESGSRSWGFASPDSDYDLRFIYQQPLDHYLKIYEATENLDLAINGDLDSNGWDLRKTLRLIARSNATPLEWLQSPVVYRETPGFKEALWPLCAQYFDARTSIHHYLGIAKGAMEALGADGSLKIKKLFYILRPLLAAQWCATRKTIAPMDIGTLSQLLPRSLQDTVKDLIAQKALAPEGAVIHVDEALHAWINAVTDSCIAEARTLKTEARPVASLDLFFKKMIYDDDDR